MKILNVRIVNTKISEYWNCWYEKYWMLELLIWKMLNVEIVGIIVWKMLNIEIVDMIFFECWNYCMHIFVLIWKMLNVGIVDMKNIVVYLCCWYVKYWMLAIGMKMLNRNCCKHRKYDIIVVQPS